MTSDSEKVVHDIDRDPTVRTLVYTCPVDHTGASVFVKGWLVPESKKRPIVLVHGLGESVECLLPVATKLAQLGHSVYGFDLRGHGQSGRKLGHIPSFNQLGLDLLQVVAWVKHKELGRKPIVIGQGLGALVSLFFAKGYSKFCYSMVLVSPLFSMSTSVNPYRRVLLKTIAEIFPTMLLPASLSPAFSQPSKSKAKKPKMSALLANELLMAISQARKQFHRHRLHTLVLCPKDDKVAKYEFLKRMIAKHKFSERLSLKHLETDTHHLLTSGGPELELAVDAIVTWIKEERDNRLQKKIEKNLRLTEFDLQNIPEFAVESHASTGEAELS